MSANTENAKASGTVDVADNLASVNARIAAATAAAGRPAGSVTLVAVPKTFPAEHIRPALVAGHRVYGENRVQEAAEKWPGLRADFPDCTLHMIGPLQTNKVREAVALFDVIETIDRPKLAAALRREIDRAGRAPSCYIEVNTGAEAQKAGVLPDDADAFIDLEADTGTPAGGCCGEPVDQDSGTCCG